MSHRSFIGRKLAVVAAASLACAGMTAAQAAASWSLLTHPAPQSTETMLLMTDGTVLVHSYDGTGNAWMRLTPSPTGSYVDGTWSPVANMGKGRLYFASHVLPDGRLWVLGGEYSDPNLSAVWTNTGEIYDPLANTWTPIAHHPEAQFGDTPTMLMDGNRILAGSLSTRNSYYYDIATNAWSRSGTKVYNDQSDEESWVKLPDGSILTYDIFQSIATGGAYAEVFQPAGGTWAGRSPSDGTAAGTIPQLSTTGVGYELGAALLLRGSASTAKVFIAGASGHTATYTPSTKTWAAGPDILGKLSNGTTGLYGSDDAPAAEMPSGHVIFAADTGPSLGAFSGPTKLFDYDPKANTITPVKPTPPVSLSGPAFTTRMLMLPTGQMLFGTASSTLAVYTPAGTPNPKYLPIVNGVSYDGAGHFTLLGKQLNGGSAGAGYGDDAEMDENYPIVSLKDTAGLVYYARTTAWSTTGVAMKKAETVNFTLKPGTPAGTLAMTVSGAGLAAAPVCMTLTADQAAGAGAAGNIALFACP